MSKMLRFRDTAFLEVPISQVKLAPLGRWRSLRFARNETSSHYSLHTPEDVSLSFKKYEDVKINVFFIVISVKLIINCSVVVTVDSFPFDFEPNGNADLEAWSDIIYLYITKTDMLEAFPIHFDSLHR